jgi:DNA-binding MarR family transcriptional regulator
VTDFQNRCMKSLVQNDGPGTTSTARLAGRLATSNVAITSAMRSLERKGLVRGVYWPENSRWAALYWHLTAEGRAAIAANQAKGDA